MQKWLKLKRERPEKLKPPNRWRYKRGRLQQRKIPRPSRMPSCADPCMSVGNSIKPPHGCNCRNHLASLALVLETIVEFSHNPCVTHSSAEFDDLTKGKHSGLVTSVRAKQYHDAFQFNDSTLCNHSPSTPQTMAAKYTWQSLFFFFLFFSSRAFEGRKRPQGRRSSVRGSEVD